MVSFLLFESLNVFGRWDPDENTKGGGVQKRALGSHAAVAFWAFMSEKEPSKL